ncbi:MAG: translation initiation factor IF-2 [Armatimonadetes bacterium]|nr:translation initiation factor IF-2 [Armatimonadota bacterium]
MAKVEIETLASELEALPSQVIHVITELGAYPENGAVEVDADTLSVVKEAVAEMVAAKEVALSPGATPRDIAHALNLGHVEVQKSLMQSGTLAALTTSLAPELAEQIVGSFGYRVRWAVLRKPKPEEEDAQKRRKRALGTRPRQPVVTILGHVDHGKTTLLDYIRRTKVAEREFGGITQHIGAYEVETDGRKITFLDTPGHEAFTAMRARGAQITDIAVLVVAADDGVMPQTIEAISHAKTADVPIVVAISKIDLPEANVDRVKQRLTEQDLVSGEFGGQTVMVPLSGKTGEGVDTLLELILLQADMMELKADPSGEVEAVVVEARLDKGRGPVATILVENGTLKQGDAVLVGHSWGKIKAMFDYAGERIKDAGPAIPAEITGLDQVPEAGDRLSVFLDEKQLRERAAHLRAEERERLLEGRGTRVSLADLQRRLEEGETKELRIIVKADVRGSVEAVRGLIEAIENAEIQVKVLHSAVGTVNDNDVLLASASGAMIVAFNTKTETQAKEQAGQQRVEIRHYKVIYELIEDIEQAVIGMLEPKYEERYLGRAEVRAAFKLTKVGHVAGCYVSDGKIVRGAKCRVRRDGEIVHEGQIASLKHIKEDMKEVQAGYECGIQFENWTGFKESDEIEAFESVQVNA